jgi:hypothetical protein
MISPQIEEWRFAAANLHPCLITCLISDSPLHKSGSNGENGSHYQPFTATTTANMKLISSYSIFHFDTSMSSLCDMANHTA